MPQMAPVLWLPMFSVILPLLVWAKSIVYFHQSHQSDSYSNKTKSITSINWMW
uniref:ATP synthase F0 subunit 8 n=1 Tax=Gammarus lacustris TaxID=52639 RepID=A0A517LS54_9CRUS|nr:ATP synthase F0 subunit 8 [Gammarus lacustris]QDS78453.1 ATP synthase F0 subunit 8 [Gammarus lacustris]